MTTEICEAVKWTTPITEMLTRPFADANSRTVNDSRKAGLFADKLSVVTALPVASSRRAGARCAVAV